MKAQTGGKKSEKGNPTVHAEEEEVGRKMAPRSQVEGERAPVEEEGEGKVDGDDRSGVVGRFSKVSGSRFSDFISTAGEPPPQKDSEVAVHQVVEQGPGGRGNP